MSVGSISSGAIYVVSSATVTASDGTKWQIHITDCTYNKKDPSQVGLKLIEIIPYSDWDAPKGFGWYSEASGQSRHRDLGEEQQEQLPLQQHNEPWQQSNQGLRT